MKIPKILIGTTNKGKQEEFRQLISVIVRNGFKPFPTLFPHDLNITEKPKETGKTFAENSLIKARFYFDRSGGIPTITDDGGLEIDVLDGEPGVKSRRWPGHEATDQEAIDFALKKMEQFHATNDRKAHLTTCITYFDGTRIINETATISGHIATKPLDHWTPGYPYRALFIVDGTNKYFQDLSAQEHASVNHRAQALRRIFDRIDTENL